MNRRGFLSSILALGCAPAIVKAEILMPVRKIIVPEAFMFDNVARWEPSRVWWSHLNDPLQWDGGGQSVELPAASIDGWTFKFENKGTANVTLNGVSAGAGMDQIDRIIRPGESLVYTFPGPQREAEIRQLRRRIKFEMR